MKRFNLISSYDQIKRIYKTRDDRMVLYPITKQEYESIEEDEPIILGHVDKNVFGIIRAKNKHPRLLFKADHHEYNMKVEVLFDVQYTLGVPIIYKPDEEGWTE